MMSKTKKSILYCIFCYILMYILLHTNYINFDDLGGGFDSPTENFTKGAVFVIAPVSLPVWLVVKNTHDLGEYLGDL